jgi:hypothetical protein
MGGCGAAGSCGLGGLALASLRRREEECSSGDLEGGLGRHPRVERAWSAEPESEPLSDPEQAAIATGATAARRQ